MQTRVKGQKEYEFAEKLLSKLNPSDEDINLGIKFLLRAIDEKYAPAIRIPLRIIIKEKNSPSLSGFEEYPENAFFQVILKNSKIYQRLSEVEFNQQQSLLLALHTPRGNVDYLPITKALLEECQSLPMAKYIYGTLFEIGARRRQAIKDAALAGLPIALLKQALIEVTGVSLADDYYQKVTNTVAGEIHYKKLKDAFLLNSPEFLSEMKLTPERKEFGFDQAMEVMANPPEPFMELSTSIAKINEIGATINNPAALLVQAINLMEKNPERAEEAFDMLQRSAFQGNHNALYIMSFLILRTLKKFSQLNPLIIENGESKSSFTQQNGVRDKTIFKLLENENIRAMLEEEYLNEKSIKIAVHYLVNWQSDESTNEVTIVLGDFLHLAKKNVTPVEIEQANQSIDELINNSNAEFLDILLAYYSHDQLASVDLLRLTHILEARVNEQRGSAPHPHLQYMFALLVNMACGISIPKEIKASKEKIYLYENNITKMAQDARVRDYLKEKYTKKSNVLTIQEGEKEYKQAETIIFELSAKKMDALQFKLYQHKLINLLEKAIKKNHPMAKYLMASNLLSGKLMIRDEVRAFVLLKEAAAAGLEFAITIINATKNGGLKKVADSMDVHEMIFQEMVKRLLTNQKVMKLLEEESKAEAKKQEAKVVPAVTVKPKDLIPEFKSEFLGTLGSKKKKPDLDKIISTDPLFLIKVVLGLVYKNLEISAEVMQELKARAASLAQCERTPEFWRLLNDGFAYGKGEAFMHKLKELGFAEPLFGESTKLDWDYIEWRAAFIDKSLKNRERPLFYNDKEVYPNYLPALFIGKELKHHKRITPDDVKVVKEKFKIPETKVSPLLFFRVQHEKDRKERLIAQILEKERKKKMVRWY